MDKHEWKAYLNQEITVSAKQFMNLVLEKYQVRPDSHPAKAAMKAAIMKFLREDVGVEHDNGEVEWIDYDMLNGIQNGEPIASPPSATVNIPDVMKSLHKLKGVLPDDEGIMLALPGSQVRPISAKTNPVPSDATLRWLLLKEKWETGKWTHKLTLAKQLVHEEYPALVCKKEIERQARNIVNRYNKETKR